MAKRVHSTKDLAYSSLPSSRGLSGVQSIKEVNVDEGTNFLARGGGSMSEFGQQSPSSPALVSSPMSSTVVRFDRQLATRVFDFVLTFCDKGFQASSASALSFPFEINGARKTRPPYPFGISTACPYICLPRNAATKRSTFLDAVVCTRADLDELSSGTVFKTGYVSESISIAASIAGCVAVTCSA